MLVEGLVRVGSPLEEGPAIARAARDAAGIVVLHLVVVPGDDERGGGVRIAQLRGALVERVQPAKLLERAVPGLVDVIAEMEDEIGLLLGEIAVGRVRAADPRLAGGDGELQRLAVAGRGQRARAADAAGLAVSEEAVVKPASRGEVGDLDVDRVGVLGERCDGAAATDLDEALVVRELPADGDWRRARVGAEPRPQHDGVVKGIAGGDAEAKRPRVGSSVGRGRRGQPARDRQAGGRPAQHREKPAPVDRRGHRPPWVVGLDPTVPPWPRLA